MGRKQTKSKQGGRGYVIGAGPAGLLAAIRAAELGAGVTVLEKMGRPAMKLGITGKGRCNITTGCDIEAAVAEFGANGRFLYGAFSRFYSAELLAFLGSRGVPAVMERGKRWFPASGKASDVVDALVGRASELGVELRTGTRVLGLAAESGGIAAVETEAGPIPASGVALATGGASYPATGSNGDGYELAATLGHTVRPPMPALVPLELKGRVHAEMEGLSLRNIRLELRLDEKLLGQEFGEAVFTAHGVSGPAALPLGRLAAENRGRGRMTLDINFKPALSSEQVDARFRREFESSPKKKAVNILPALLPRLAVPVIARLSGLDPARVGAEVTRAERAELVRLLTGLRFRVRGARPLAEAIVTAGGVALDEVDPRTMESKLVRGLFICGELLDLDAGTGGFNLQAAFSTGWVAGEALARTTAGQ